MTAQPDGTFAHDGVECARWGQLVIPAGEEVEPIPAVYSSPNEIEFGDYRISLDTAEAFIARLQAAVAYERARTAGDGR